jgi:hypothetical protein
MSASSRSDSSPWRRQAARLLGELEPRAEPARRLRQAAEALLGAPYARAPLGGGPGQPERLSLRLDAFDCVTLVESCLALARSATPAAFRRELSLARYREGRIAWASRLHYFSDWLRWNRRRGALGGCLGGPGARSLEVRLALVPGLPARRTRLVLVPRRALAGYSPRMAPALVVAFASLRRGLDFFHVGLLFGDSPAQPAATRTLIHAALSRGGVVAEPLGEFLGRNRTRGLALAGLTAKGEMG